MRTKDADVYSCTERLGGIDVYRDGELVTTLDGVSFNDFDFEDQLVDAIDDSIETDNIINKLNEQRYYE